MDDLSQIFDHLPAIPPRYAALALLTVLVWEHVLASTQLVRANSTIRLVGDVAVAVVRRIARRPPPPALRLLLAVAVVTIAACSSTETARWRDAGRCAGIAAVRQVAGAAITMATATPDSPAAWEAFGSDLLRRYGRDALGCAAELVAAAPVVDQAAAGASPAAPRPIGFALPARAAGDTTSARAAGDVVPDLPVSAGSVTPASFSPGAAVPRPAHDFAAQLLAR